MKTELKKRDEGVSSEREGKMNLPKEIIQVFGLIEDSDNNEEFLAEEGIWTQGEAEEDILRELWSSKEEKAWVLNGQVFCRYIYEPSRGC